MSSNRLCLRSIPASGDSFGYTVRQHLATLTFDAQEDTNLECALFLFHALEQLPFLTLSLPRPHLPELVHGNEALREAVERIDQRDDFRACEQVMVNLRAEESRHVSLTQNLETWEHALESRLVELK